MSKGNNNNNNLSPKSQNQQNSKFINELWTQETSTPNSHMHQLGQYWRSLLLKCPVEVQEHTNMQKTNKQSNPPTHQEGTNELHVSNVPKAKGCLKWCPNMVNSALSKQKGVALGREWLWVMEMRVWKGGERGRKKRKKKERRYTLTPQHLLNITHKNPFFQNRPSSHSNNQSKQNRKRNKTQPNSRRNN